MTAAHPPVNRRSDWVQRLLDGLYPPTCVLCGDRGEPALDLCRGCRESLPLNSPCCPTCAHPLPQPPAGPRCGRCLTRRPPYDRVLAAFRYTPPLDTLVTELKFNGRLAFARLLGVLTADRLASRLTDPPDAVLPVPLHAARVRQRGYDQALELARTITRRLDLRLDPRLCRRLRHTAAQADLPAGRRRGNVRGAFRVVRPPPYRHVALFDDVVTTGSTGHELARVLRRAGVPRIELWCCARTPPP